jgi:hypothetical protein
MKPIRVLSIGSVNENCEYGPMRFRIEIIRESSGRTEVVYQTTIDEISPNRAKVKATALLDLYSGRGANSARIFNEKNEELYRL